MSTADASDDTASVPTREQLHRSLGRVHAALAATPHVDGRSQQLLRELLVDIERLLQEQPAQGGAAERLEGLAVQFETRHPVLAATVRQFVELLERAGL